MNRRLAFTCALLIALLGASSCSGPTASGAYLAQGGTNIQLLQITEQSNGELQGTFTWLALNQSGEISEDSSHFNGVIDGTRLTIHLESSQLAGSGSLSGTYNGDEVLLVLPTGSARFEKTSTKEFEAEFKGMRGLSAAIKNKQIEDKLDEEALALNQQLHDFASAASAPENETQIEMLRDTHRKALAEAQHRLARQKEFPRNSIEASRINVDINQIEVRLHELDRRWEDVSVRRRKHLRTLDASIQSSVCRQLKASSARCADQAAVIEYYENAKPLVGQQCSEIERILEDGQTAILKIVRESDDYVL